MGVTSLMAEISRPAACSDRMAASRPAPGPLTQTSTRLRPWLIASRALASAATCAAKGVLLREPLKPTLPALAHVMTAPSVSVIVTMVLLKLAWMWATPFTPTLRSRFFGFLTSATRYLRSGPSPPRGRAARRSPAYVPGFFATDGFAAGAALRTAPAVFFGPLRVRALVLV